MRTNGHEGKWCVPCQDLDHTNLPNPPLSSPSCGWRSIMTLDSLKSLNWRRQSHCQPESLQRLCGAKIVCLRLLTWNIHFCFTLRWEENKPSLCLSYYIFSFFLVAIRPTQINTNDNVLWNYKEWFFFRTIILSSALSQFNFLWHMSTLKSTSSFK